MSSDAPFDEGFADGPAQGILTGVKQRAHPDPREIDLPTRAHGGDDADAVPETVLYQVGLRLCVVNAIDHVVGVVGQQFGGATAFEQAFLRVDLAGVSTDVGGVLFDTLGLALADIGSSGEGMTVEAAQRDAVKIDDS